MQHQDKYSEGSPQPRKKIQSKKQQKIIKKIDENKKILYCEDEEAFKKYCQDNNLKYEYKKDDENYINTGGNKYISSVNGNFIQPKAQVKTQAIQVQMGTT